MVRLDAGEVKEWLDKWKENEQVCKGEEFTVPNTFILGIGIQYSLISSAGDFVANITYYNQGKIQEALEHRGFLVKRFSQENGNTAQQVQLAILNRNTWGYSLFGHGAKDISTFNSEWDGALEWDEGVYLMSDSIYRGKLKYGLGINYHCFATSGSWSNYAIKSYGGFGLSFQIAGPTQVGYFGTWDGLVGSAAD